MKQGRAFGVGVLVATQNPMALDYRALSNAGFWAVGRLQTDADRARVVESLAHANQAGSSPAEISNVLRRLGPRWFMVRDVHAETQTVLLCRPLPPGRKRRLSTRRARPFSLARAGTGG